MNAALFRNIAASYASFVKLHDAPDFYYRTYGPGSLGTMSLSVEDMTSASVMAGLDLKLPCDTMLATPPATAMARLQRLYAAAGHLAEEDPEIIVNPDTAQGLEQTLIEAMVDCVGYRQQHENTLAQGQHQTGRVLCGGAGGDFIPYRTGAGHGPHRSGNNSHYLQRRKGDSPSTEAFARRGSPEGDLDTEE